MRARHRPSTLDRTGRGGHCRRGRPRRRVQPRRNATIPGALGASVTDLRTDARTEDGRAEGSRSRVTSRVTKARNSASSRLAYRRDLSDPAVIDRLPRRARGDRPCPAGFGAGTGPVPHRAGAAGWRRRPRTSRSSRSTRAAATRSGSREIVRASQSMYVGSKSATWPSVWPWNLPNSIGHGPRRLERGRHRRPEVALAMPPDRAVRLRRAQRLAAQAIVGRRRLWRVPDPRAGGRVARPERRRRVDAAGEWALRTRLGWPRAATGGRPVAVRLANPGGAQLRVGTVDLRHAAGRALRRGRVGLGQSG